MKVVFLTLGSRGDVQPYVAIGISLIERGHEVTIATGHTFQTFIESQGIHFVETHADFMKILETPEGEAIFNGGKMSIFKIMNYMKTTINPLFRETFDDFYQACQGADIIIAHPKAMVAYDIAEALKIPCVSMPPVPMLYPTQAFPNLAVSPSGNFGPWLNKLTYKVLLFSESSSMEIINDFRVNTLKLSKRKMGKYSHFDRQEVIYPISSALFKNVKDWGRHLTLTGFPFLPLKESTLPSSIESFINEKGKPWVISFSSMPASGLEAIIEETLTLRKENAIFIAGNSKMHFTSDRIKVIDRLPHRLIFKEAKGILHHGGIGTTAEALLSGRPQQIIPFNVDQPFWANRLHQLDLMGPVVKPQDMTVDQLNTILSDMCQETRISKAQAFSNEIRLENGIENAAIAIERIQTNAQKDI